MDEERDNLHWHALNFRTAATQHAEAMWQELQACVERKVAAERERCLYCCELGDREGYAAELIRDGTQKPA
jgi:hypothetical protein